MHAHGKFQRKSHFDAASEATRGALTVIQQRRRDWRNA
jgi:hypothetical protein